MLKHDKGRATLFCTLLTMLGLFGSTAVAAPQLLNPVSISSSPSPVGSGARAMGSGGAFIAVADDATAASWNPAGLIQLETTEISVVASQLYRRELFTSVSNPELNGPQGNNNTEINYFSIATPIRLPWINAVVSINYQELYELNKTLNYSTAFNGSEVIFPGLPPIILPIVLAWDINQNDQIQQQGGLRALSPAISIQVTPAFSLGMTVNVWTDRLGYDNGWQQKSTSVASGTLGILPNLFPVSETRVQRDEYDHLKGVSFHFGALWEVNNMLRLGVVVKTPFSIRMRHKSYSEHIVNGTTTGPTSFEERVRMHFPLTYGAGVSLRFSDTFSMAMDVSRTEWNDFYLQDGRVLVNSPLDGMPLSQSGVASTHQVRLGGEYLFILPSTVIPLRAGLYYDPQPSPTGKDNVYGISIGTGYQYKNMIFDLAYTYDWGSGLNGAAAGIPGSTSKLKRHRLYASLIMHFD